MRPSARTAILLIMLAAMPLALGQARANDSRSEAQAEAVKEKAAFEWVTLGTIGGPVPSRTRGEPANLLVRKGEAHLVDVGDGAATAMLNAGTFYPQLRSIWISHIHFDHIGGLFGVLGLRLQARVTTPLTIYGPPGTRAIVDGLIAAMRPSARAGLGVPGEEPVDPAASITVVELDDGAVVAQGDFKVRVASNTHYSFPPGSENAKFFRSLSFRFDLPERSIVYTGDTGPSDRVTALAKGADMLITEMLDIDAARADLRRFAQQLSRQDAAKLEHHMRAHHVTTADIGKMASEAGVKDVVVTHIGGVAAEEPGAATRYEQEIRKLFGGRVRVANDMDRF